MLFDIFFYIIGYFIDIIGSHAPAWVIWPDFVPNGLAFFAGKFSEFNIIFPVDQIFYIITFDLNFIAGVAFILIVIKIFDYARGAGSLKS